MVIEAKKLVDMERGLLHRSIFYDQAIYEEELEKVFGRAWLFIGHDSLVPNPNDFFLTYMGEDPVILTRDSKGELHAFLNMCRHRGNRVARADDGNAKNFMCTYHGWTYSNEGKLVSVPGLQEAYYGELEVDKLGLVSVAKLGTYAGFVFATWDAEAPSLEDWMGDARYYLDLFLNRRDGGIQMYGPEKWILPTNWKMPADNFGTDNYHVGITHRSQVLVRAQHFGRPAPPQFQQIEMGQHNPQYTVHGHSVGGNLIPDDPQATGTQNFMRQDPVIAKYLDSFHPELERRVGSFRANRVQMSVNNLFPNLAIHGNSMIRLWLPRGPLKTEVWGFQLIDKAAPPEVRDVLRRTSMLAFSAGGIQECDDADNWIQCVQNSKTTIAKRYPSIVSMGIGKAAEEGELPGYRAPNNVNEERQRRLYGRWAQFMDAESWADIPVYPPAADYEGTATFEG